MIPPAAIASDFRLCGQQVEDRSRHEALPDDGQITPHPDAASSLLTRRVEVQEDGEPRDPQFCGAALIAPNWAVTARHCVDHKRWYEMRIAGGAHLVGAPGQGYWRRGEAAFCPRDAIPGKITQDIALIRLNRPAPDEAAILNLAGVSATLAMAPSQPATIGSWRWGDAEALRAPITVNPYTVTRAGDDPFLVATRVFTHKPGPCAGESGSVARAEIAGETVGIGVLTAVFDPDDQGEGTICRRASARALLTPLAAYRIWIETTMAACDADVAACLSRELSSPPHEP